MFLSFSVSRSRCFSGIPLLFYMIQQMLAIWSLFLLPFLNPPCTSGSCWFIYCWSLAWRILSITLLACEMSTLVHNHKQTTFAYLFPKSKMICFFLKPIYFTLNMNRQEELTVKCCNVSNNYSLIYKLYNLLRIIT